MTTSPLKEWFVTKTKSMTPCTSREYYSTPQRWCSSTNNLHWTDSRENFLWKSIRICPITLPSIETSNGSPVRIVQLSKLREEITSLKTIHLNTNTILSGGNRLSTMAMRRSTKDSAACRGVVDRQVDSWSIQAQHQPTPREEGPLEGGFWTQPTSWQRKTCGRNSIIKIIQLIALW